MANDRSRRRTRGRTLGRKGLTRPSITYHSTPVFFSFFFLFRPQVFYSYFQDTGNTSRKIVLRCRFGRGVCVCVCVYVCVCVCVCVYTHEYILPPFRYLAGVRTHTNAHTHTHTHTHTQLYMRRLKRLKITISSIVICVYVCIYACAARPSCGAFSRTRSSRR